MRGPLVAAAAIVFVLAVLDSNIPPLVFAFETWASEMTAVASIAWGAERPAGLIVWSAWPMLAVIAVLAAAAAPGMREMTRWGDDAPDEELGGRVSSSPWAWAVGCLVALVLAVVPLVVFTFDLATAGTSLWHSFETVWRTSGNAIIATAVVAVLAGTAASVVALAVLDEPNRPRWQRFAGNAAVALTIGVAILPPELTGMALRAFFQSEIVSPRHMWNVYDNSPVVWVAAMVARFGFLPVCLARLLNRRVPASLTDQALADGHGFLQRIAHLRLPMLWRPILAAGLLVGCLTLSEVSASRAIEPSQFIGGSIAVHVDAQMHYQRQNETVALSLALIVVCVLVAVILPQAASLRRAPRQGMSAGRGGGRG
jgi:ABC-type Fe3+ transport system permease subunit